MKVDTGFTKRSAELYDYLYARKDYRKEAEWIARHMNIPIGGRIIEFGSGTGRYCRAFRDLGYIPTGVEIDQDFLEVARRDAAGILYFHGDVTANKWYSRNHVALALFNVVGYATRGDVTEKLKGFLATLVNNSKYSRQAGVICGDVGFDFVNTACAASDLTNAKADYHVVLDGKPGVLVRTVQKTFHAHRSEIVYDMHYALGFDEGGEVQEWTEQHVVRTFTPNEIAFAMQSCGLTPRIVPAFSNRQVVETSDFYCFATGVL